MSSHNSKSTPHTARPSREGQLKTAPPCAMPMLDPKTKLAARFGQKPEVNRVSCFICKGLHYAKDCPPENRKAACGYAVQIVEEGTPTLLSDAELEHLSDGLIHKDKNAQSPEPDNPSSDDDGGDSHLEGEQYDPDEVNQYPFSYSNESEPVYSQAT